MPYDPRMLQMAQMGVGMMGPQQGPQRGPQRPKQWWEQPVSMGKMGGVQSPQDQPQPSLLQMLMMGGKPTYSGTPQPGGNAGGSMPPWAWLGGMGMPGGAGLGGPGGGR